MIYNYNGLWKQLINSEITKTQLRKMAGISTNIFAKIRKGESVAMESPVKVATTLGCGPYDIIEVKKGDEWYGRK